MDRDELLNILRNPYGRSETECREARLQAANDIEILQKAYLNMRDFAEKNSLDTMSRN